MFAAAILVPSELLRAVATLESICAPLSWMIDSSVSPTKVASVNEKPGSVSLLVMVFAAVCEADAGSTPAELSDSEETSRIFDTAVLAALMFNAA